MGSGDEQPSGAQRPAADQLLVRLAVAGPHATAVRRFVESTAGWQPTAGGPLQPAVSLADCAGLGSQPPGDGVPVVLLVGDEVAAPAAARAGAAGVAAVVAWPGERDRLRGLAADLRRDEPEARPELTVGGAAGGVGTTTVALGLAGLTAWRGARVLVVTHGSVPAPAGGPLDPGALAGPGVWRAAASAPGLTGLRVVATASPAARGRVNAGPADLVVRDLGADADADVLVLRRDAAGLAALQATAAGTVVCADAGPARLRAVREAASGRRLIRVPWSVRVARAGLSGRVPAGLPGAWLARLAPAAPAAEAVVHRQPDGRSGAPPAPA